ncbi:thiamine pyrophosphate-dependent enzyme [Methanofollis fontis]|uniref:Indolepyruvate ferredoxin oxidoreductase n=1 Tax=Methanofollis fontis TaxID=2052832 RepID=A0A483CUT0_9EURY|nr:thiamine pyrophosphate-dependent enzyme [Methanofollis fontis]TAJ45207.1 indolepyruvate ferredoxin oxidoreductase [Methanofollis fontis]
MDGEAVLAKALRRAAPGRIFTVPGYPVTGCGVLAGAEICTNEKVALEYALGSSLAARPAAVLVKNVGMNLLADPLVQATAQGLRAPVVVVVGDDPHARASQAAQDSRPFGPLAMVPVVEAESAEDLPSALVEAFALSAALSRVALLRVTPDILQAEAGEVKDVGVPTGQGEVADPALTMRGRWAHALQTAAAHADHRPPEGVRVAMPPADAPQDRPETFHDRGYFRTFCRGCPFRPLFALLERRGMRAAVDAGCSLLALNPPGSVGIASYGLGSAVAVGARATGVALIGDYAILHSGINALIDVHEKGVPLLCIVIENRRMGMVGGSAVADISRYLEWARPSVVEAADMNALDRLIRPSDGPKTVIVRGNCPGGESHEQVEC